MDVPRLHAKNDRLGQSKGNTETTKHGQRHTLALGPQDGLADEVKDRSLRRAAQNRTVKKTNDRAVRAPARAAGGGSFNQLTDSAAVGQRIGQKSASEHCKECIAAGSGQEMEDR